MSAAQLGVQTGAIAADSALGEAIPYVGAALGAYNFVNTATASGKTGSDALNGAMAGAQTGAAVGTIFPGIGTAIGAVAGAVIGGIGGAVSSAFGPGAKDPEQNNWDTYFSAYQKGGSQAVSGGTGADNYQTLAGIFDARSSDVPFYNQFGRAGEGTFMSSMGNQINSAISSGTISKSATPQQIYSKVVQPWINSMPGASSYNQSNGYQGDAPAISQLVQNLIGNWQSGQKFTGVNGTSVNMPSYGS